MRVVVLTHYFPPEVGAPQARLGALAEGLRARGVDVRVHAPFPHYPHGTIPPPYRNRAVLIERRSGVVRSAVYASPNRGFAGRLANHLSFAASALVTHPLTGPADVVIVESPPLFLAAAGAVYARAKGARLIVNVADRWPASAVELGALSDARAIRAAEALEGWCYRHAAAVTVPTRGLVRDLEREATAAGKVRRIGPAVDARRFAGLPPPGSRPGPLRVLYAGTIGMAHGLATLVEAAGRLGPRVVQVRIAGGGAEEGEVRAAVKRRGAANVEFLGVVAADRVPELYAWADAGAVLLRDRPIFAGALPTKLLEVMAAARPVVLSGRGESAELVDRAAAGVVVAPEDPATLAHAFQRLHSDRDAVARLGANGRVAALRGFSRSAMVQRWRALLEEVVAPKSGYTPGTPS